MAQRTCSLDGCDKPSKRRTLCNTHSMAALRAKGKGRTYYTRTCVGCGQEFQSQRPDGKICSDACRSGGRPFASGARSLLPREHPVRMLLNHASSTLPDNHPVRYVAWWYDVEVGDCEWCGTAFATRVLNQRFCCHWCKCKAVKVRRRGRAAGSTSHYTWAEVMRLFVKLGRCCAYCEQPVDGQPDPDHVVPLSRGGSNSITNILPSCHTCNGDKRDLLLSEWAVDRERRGLPPRATDPHAWTHLTDALLAA